MVRDGKVLPVTDNILEGITRRSVIELLEKEMGVQVIERPIDRTEVYLCDEFFMTGTAAQVVAVTRVDHRLLGKGEMGPLTHRLRELFAQAVVGRHPAYRHWNTAVYSEAFETVG
jgi:branched-chain amino acid aminotransferase